MSKEFEYFKVHRTKNNNIPLLDPDDGCPRYLNKKVPIEQPELMLFKIGKPVPKNPLMADYHSSPDSVVSKKIFNVLSHAKIDGLQLLPATIKGIQDQIFSDYWALHIYHRLQCVDAKLSDCVIDDISLSYVKKIVLDKKKLEALPLANRLIFRLKEDSSYELYHTSIVDKIMNVHPEGIRFTNIEDWNEGSAFK